MDRALPFAAADIARRVALIGSAGPSIQDRIGFLRERANGKRVLDVGIVEHSHEATKSEHWLHRHIVNVSEYCLGIDILEHDIQMLKNDGFNVRVHDLCKESLDEKFDLIIMGEILEHVNDPYSLLLNASRSLEKEGEIILSTPNPWYISYLKEVSRQGFAVDNVDHIAWFDPATIYSLVDRADLKLISYHGLSSMTVNSTLGRVLAWLVNRISNLGLFPLSNSKSILYVIRK